MSSKSQGKFQGILGVALILVLAALTVFRSHPATRLDGFTVDEAWHIVAKVPLTPGATSATRDGTWGNGFRRFATSTTA